MNLNSHRELDWLQLSRFVGGSSESILALDGLLHGRTISEEMFERLPKGYIARLLGVIRNELTNFEHNQQLIERVVASRLDERNELLLTAQQTEARLMDSKSKLAGEQDELKAKAELLKKLRAKIARKQKAMEAAEPEKKKQPETRYYCPFCRSDSFTERDSFEKHMKELHNPSSQDTQVQNFILELKDKEIALMELVMKKNEDMNEAARTLMERELHSRTHDFRRTFAATSSQPNDSVKPFEQELLCESEFIAFQNENVSEQNLPKYYDASAQKEKIHETIMQRHAGYKSMRPTSNHFQRATTGLPSLRSDHNGYGGWTIKEEVDSEAPRLQSLKPQRPVPLSIRAYETPNPSYRVLNYDIGTSKKTNSNNHNNSIYQTNSVSVDSYVYCAGPLMDDDSDSEVGDYFFRKSTQKLVIDEDIVLDEKLLSKWGSSLMQSGLEASSGVSPAKIPSELLSAADDSIEDKDFSLSKDSCDINLSELRYSKIVRAKQTKEEKPAAQGEKPSGNLFPIVEHDELRTTRQSGFLDQYVQRPPEQQLEGTACFNPVSFRKKSPEKVSRLLEEFYGSGEGERPRRSSSKTEKPLAETATDNPPAKKPSCRKMERPMASCGQKTERRSKIQRQEPISAEAGDYNPQQPTVEVDPTERYILKQLDDLTLIKQDEHEQTVSAEVQPQ